MVPPECPTCGARTDTGQQTWDPDSSGLAFVTVTILHLEVAVAGVGWLLLGIIIYVLYRRQHGLDLRTTALALRPERPPELPPAKK